MMALFISKQLPTYTTSSLFIDGSGTLTSTTDYAITLKNVDPTLTVTYSQSMCEQVPLKLLANNDPIQTLIFLVRSETNEQKSFNPFTVNDTTCGEAPFNYNIIQTNNKPFPENMTYLNNSITIGYYDAKAKYNMCVTGKLPTLQQIEIEIQISIEGNYGPPVFQEDLVPLMMNAGESLVYQLPQISDPDGDPVAVNVNLGSAQGFTQYINGKFLFKP